VFKAATILNLLFYCSICLHGQDFLSPDTVTIQSGKLELKALLWRPMGSGPFPTIIYCHGSYATDDTRYDPVQQVSVMGEVFAKNGYVFLGLFRRGTGLSKDQGENEADQMAKAFKERGQEERNKVQLQQLQTDQLMFMISGLGYLRQNKEVDTNRIAVLGHSFGGSLAMLVAEYASQVKAAVIAGAAGNSWNLSPPLRTRLFTAAKNITAPVMIIHAQNDYSTNPGYALDSIMNQLHKPHLLKIYPPFGKTGSEGHNFMFLSTSTWQVDVFEFLRKSLK
jgi:carboxymethylenebutenolidase